MKASTFCKHGNNNLHDGLPSDELRVILSDTLEKEMYNNIKLSCKIKTRHILNLSEAYTHSM